MAKRDAFTQMVSLRTPIGAGNGLPLKGPRPGAGNPKPKNTLPLRKKG